MEEDIVGLTLQDDEDEARLVKPSILDFAAKFDFYLGNLRLLSITCLCSTEWRRGRILFKSRCVLLTFGFKSMTSPLGSTINNWPNNSKLFLANFLTMTPKLLLLA
ncbi:hypothetical protein GOBAR_DD00019 [Gossypium barbadense]|nr:hypothetical protein GOBAR_DD00019 [Gossypium barbadense]